MKKLIWLVVVLAIGGAGGWYYYSTRPSKEPTVSTVKTSRGSIVDAVGATGTLTAVTTVTVGTQVGGIVQSLEGVDFNSIVKKGQVIARLDPSILETQVATAKANLTNAQANLERQKVAVDDAKSKLVRARELSARQLINKVDLENAEVSVKSAEAQMRSTQSSIVQAEASVNKATVDLDHTVITAPIDGIIIKRSVDRGQTVNAGMSAPELFIIAADLTQMQVNASIDETDVGRMRPGQVVTFRVDAYPTEQFHGSVRQVRLNPVTVQNVVTYSTVIDVPNPELKLKPGMTANVNVEIARRDNALRIPNAAIRFRPTADIFAALNQPMPPELERGRGGRGNRGGNMAGGPGGAGGGQPGAGGPGSAPAAPGAAPAAAANPPAAGGAPGASRTPATATAGQVEAGAQNARRGGGQPSADPSAGSGQGGQGGTGGRNRQQGGGNSADGGNGQGGGRQGGGGGNQAGGGGGQGGRGDFANMTPEEREKRRQERLAAMTPEQRALAEERRKQFEASGGMRGQGGRGGFGGPGGGPGGPGGGNAGGRGGQGGGNAGNFQRGGTGAGGPGGGNPGNFQRGQAGQQGQPANSSKSAATTSATTIDALFAPLQTVETRGRAWLYVNKQLKPVELRLGITDGTFTEVINDSELPADTDVVTTVITPEMAARPAGANNPNANNPLMPQRGRGPGGQPGGGGGGGGRGGGRG